MRLPMPIDRVSLDHLRPFLEQALIEDIDGTDVTSAAIFAETDRACLDLVSRASGIVSGIPIAAEVFRLNSCKVHAEIPDGLPIAHGSCLLCVSGPVIKLLEAERVALNLLSHMSGIATLTSRWVEAVRGTQAKIRDTRKTIPGLRGLDKYAVRCGGGENHRFSLAEAVLIKDNHILAAGGVAEAMKRVRERVPHLAIEIEIDTLDQLREAVELRPELILLDNMDVPTLRQAVHIVDGRVKLEASGGLFLERAREVARTGVNYMAIGALTHSAPALDIGADLVVSSI